MKKLLYLAVVVSVFIALYEIAFWIFESEIGVILTVISCILAFYGYVLLQLLQKKKK